MYIQPMYMYKDKIKVNNSQRRSKPATTKIVYMFIHVTLFQYKVKCKS